MMQVKDFCSFQTKVMNIFRRSCEYLIKLRKAQIPIRYILKLLFVFISTCTCIYYHVVWCGKTTESRNENHCKCLETRIRRDDIDPRDNAFGRKVISIYNVGTNKHNQPNNLRSFPLILYLNFNIKYQCDKLIWCTIGPKSFLFCTVQFSLWARWRS